MTRPCEDTAGVPVPIDDCSDDEDLTVAIPYETIEEIGLEQRRQRLLREGSESLAN